MAFHKNLRGLDLHAPTNELVENNTTALIPKLKVVRLDQMGAIYPRVLPANPGAYQNFGIAATDIPAGGFGYVTCFGFLFDVDTSPWAVGTELYSDSSGNLTVAPLGGIVATVVKQHATQGVLYVLTELNASASSISWRLDGNSGTNELVNFLGTLDASDLRIRTNNQLMAVFNKQGRLAIGPDLTSPLSHFHQKTHVGYSGSGLRTETWSLTTSSTSYVTAISIPIDDNSVVKVEFDAVCRVHDGSERAAFKRMGLFFRESSNVQQQGLWHSLYTEKSALGFDVSYVLGVSDLFIRVRSAKSDNTFWTGHVKIEAIKTDT